MTSVDNHSTTTMNRPTFTSDASRAAITNEHLALVGFAARLGTTMTNDTSNSGEDAKSVRDEAMLLMSLLTGKKASEILSEEIGLRDFGGDGNKESSSSSRPKDRDMGNFSFSFPLLSLQPDNQGGEQKGDEDRDQDEEEDLPPPSQLLGRMQSIHDKDAIRDSSDTMARNVLESFGAALVWRAKTWIQSLCRVLALKEQRRIEEQAKREKNGDEDSSQDDNNDDIMCSREMQIIDAIVRSSEEVSAVNIKTSFRVLPVRIRDNDDQEPMSKKLKNDPKEYKVKHKLIFEATVSMTCNDGGERYRTVKLQAPGEIEGTFIAGYPTSEGDDTLSGVSITLDTDSLALCLEKQSRVVVRRAAEASILTSSGMDHDSSRGQNPVISPRYVLMSPMQQQHYASDHEGEEHRSSMGSTSTPSQPFDGFVSSSEIYSSDSSAITASSNAPKRVTPTSAASFQPQSPLPALLEVADAEFRNPEH